MGVASNTGRWAWLMLLVGVVSTTGGWGHTTGTISSSGFMYSVVLQCVCVSYLRV